MGCGDRQFGASPAANYFIRAEGPHHLIQSCWLGSWATPLKSHHRFAGVAVDCPPAAAADWVLYARFACFGSSNTARQLGLSCDFFASMQAMMALTLGIEELHRRNTSGVHAARCSDVPNALLDVEYNSEPNTIIKAPAKIAALFMASPHLVTFE
jgi:hypothetical protein